MTRRTDFDTEHYRNKARELKLKYPVLSNKDIAAILGCSRSSISVYLKRVRIKQNVESGIS